MSENVKDFLIVEVLLPVTSIALELGILKGLTLRCVEVYEMKEEFDYKKYWIARSKQKIHPLKKSGIKAFSEESNRCLYYLIKEQYRKLLRKCSVDMENKNILDAGAGFGQYVRFFLAQKARVTAIDISEDAVNFIRKRFPEVKAVAAPLEELDEYFSPYQFDIIHCFDVLYHITDDGAWERTMRNFAELSKRYIILHERFSNVKPIICSKHIKWRSKEKTTAELKKYGFYEIGSVPTALVRRLFTFRILNFFPSLSYRMEKGLLDKEFAYKIGASFIKIFGRDFE